MLIAGWSSLSDGSGYGRGMGYRSARAVNRGFRNAALPHPARIVPAGDDERGRSRTLPVISLPSLEWRRDYRRRHDVLLDAQNARDVLGRDA
jgi:hypothetical protein